MNLEKLIVGQKINEETLEEMFNSQSFSKHNSQIIGEAMLWKNGEHVCEFHHLKLAPEKTTVFVREHYFGDAVICKLGNEWFVTEVKQTHFC